MLINSESYNMTLYDQIGDHGANAKEILRFYARSNDRRVLKAEEEQVKVRHFLYKL